MEEKKIAFITGGTAGIGKECALILAKEGIDIAINCRKAPNEYEDLKVEIEKYNVKCLLTQGDVSKYEDAEKMVKEVIDEFGKIDILLNNAGITKDNLLIRMKKEDFEDVINVNLIGTFNITKNVIPYMMKKRYGRIINMASVVGISGNAGQSNYAASKAGIIGFTKSLAKELGSRNILVNAIAPGYIKTAMTEVLSDKVKEQIQGQIPLGTLGEPKDVANLVKFLSSEDSSYITGQVIHVDGGMLI